jgi:ankyrin repeat protein
VDEMRRMARDPEHRRAFEKLLYLAAQRGDADIVVERLSWGIDLNCRFARGRTPLIANVCGSSPSAATVWALLNHGADPDLTDESGLTALDFAPKAGPPASPPGPPPQVPFSRRERPAPPESRRTRRVRPHAPRVG